MKKLTFGILLMALGCLISFQPVVGQDGDGGPGGFIDWIHKLSGPRMVGPGASFYWEYEKVRLRFAGVYRVSVSDLDAPYEDADIHMVSIQPSIDFKLGGDWAINAGAALHWFGGDFDRAFWHWSFPLYLQWRPELESLREGFFFRVGAGYHYFLKFHERDFGELPTGVDKESGEFSFPNFSIGFEYRLRPLNDRRAREGRN
ncbi:MAG: hypothetical protein HKO65_12950 [Gemmatimonadetes bacterium]|nr:hypothetical protein [Gemmatimonadota bacterium]NNM05990.1 hypothetical protein [Gemmatimonadota bacterium]